MKEKKCNDHDLLHEAGIRYTDSIELKGIAPGKSKVSMDLADQGKNAYSALVDAAGGVAAMTYLENGEKLHHQYSSIGNRQAPYPLLFAEASVKKREKDQITVNVSVLGMGGETLDFGQVTYKISR